VNLTLLYIDSEVVIPAPIFIGINSSGDPAQQDWIPRIKYGAGLVKPGMTNKEKDFMTHYTRNLVKDASIY
jgi:hypothetical protein